jgi:hypothetical protein
VFKCSLPLAADRARRPPTLSSLADKKRIGSLLLNTAARDPVFNCRTSMDEWVVVAEFAFQHQPAELAVLLFDCRDQLRHRHRSARRCGEVRGSG